MGTPETGIVCCPSRDDHDRVIMFASNRLQTQKLYKNIACLEKITLDTQHFIRVVEQSPFRPAPAVEFFCREGRGMYGFLARFFFLLFSGRQRSFLTFLEHYLGARVFFLCPRFFFFFVQQWVCPRSFFCTFFCRFCNAVRIILVYTGPSVEVFSSVCYKA